MGQTISFCIAPHPDDWLFFYGAPSYSADRIVWIYITAGDAGRSDGWWQARERGALAASNSSRSAPENKLGFATFDTPLSGISILKSGPQKLQNQDKEIRSINGHPIVRYLQQNSASYFMRLPDGLPDGAGSALHSYQSLTKLRDQQLPMRAVDSSTIYTSWNDFCATLAEIMEVESQGFRRENISLHAPEYDPLLNPNDHADHQATAEAVRLSALGQTNCFGWLSYCIYYYPPNLSTKEVEMKRRLFLSYSEGAEIEPDELEWACWGHQNYCKQNRPIGPPLSEWFDPKHLFNQNIPYQQCGAVREQKEAEGLRATNQLTQQSVLLNPVAEIFWHLLKTPHTLEELSSILSATHGDSSRKMIHSLLEVLLNAKLILTIHNGIQESVFDKTIFSSDGIERMSTK